MDRHDPKNSLNAQILEEAADWLIELSPADGDPRARRQFDAWLRKSPEHLRAYLELLPVWEDGAALAPERDISIDELIAMGKSAESNVIPFDAQPQEPSAAPTTQATRTRRSGFLLAASILFMCIAGGLTWLFVTRGTYATGIGEQRSLVLEDGSTINLNAHSKVRVRFTAHQRAIELLDGQALFQVSKDAARPFVVSADETQVRAVGTEFDVNRRKRGTVVTVVDGTVAVFSAGTPGSSASAQRVADRERAIAALRPHRGELLLTAGEQVTLSGATAPKAVRANVAIVTAWTQRRLVFDASTLSEVVEEFNRYNTHQLVLRDRTLENFPITAAFSSPDPASLVRFLELQPGIRIDTTGDEIEIAIRH